MAPPVPKAQNPATFHIQEPIYNNPRISLADYNVTIALRSV